MKSSSRHSRYSLTSLLLSSILLAALLPGCDQSKSGETSAPPDQHSSTPSSQQLTNQHEDQPVDVLIVGGGLSGLSTAHQLKKVGISYRILELAPRVGGRVRTGTYPEQVQAEVGLAEFWDGNPALDIVKELGVKMERVDTGLSSFMHEGKLQPFTQDSNQEFIANLLGPADYKAYQAWDKKITALQHELEDREPGPELIKLKDISFEDWLKQQKLPPKAFALIKAALDPEIGTSISRISALDGIAEWHIFSGKGANPNHVVGGNQNLTEAIADHIGREHISVNTQVTNVIDTPEGVEVRAMETGSFKNKVFKAKYAVLAIPLYRLFEIQFAPRLGDKIYEAVHTQTWGAYFTAHVLLDKSAAKYWTQDDSSVLPILTGGPLGVMYEGIAPPDSPYVFVNHLVTGDFAEVFNARTMSLDDVQKQLEEAYEKSFPGSRQLIKKWTFYRYHPRAVASWPVGRSRFDALSNELRKAHGHLYFGGDFTESSHSDGAVLSAQRVSKQIGEVMGKKVGG